MLKLFKVCVLSLGLSALAFIIVFVFLSFLFGIEWAFTSIESNRFIEWLEDNWKNPVKIYYVCLSVCLVIAYKAESLTK